MKPTFSTCQLSHFGALEEEMPRNKRQSNRAVFGTWRVWESERHGKWYWLGRGEACNITLALIHLIQCDESVKDTLQDVLKEQNREALDLRILKSEIVAMEKRGEFEKKSSENRPAPAEQWDAGIGYTGKSLRSTGDKTWYEGRGDLSSSVLFGEKDTLSATKASPDAYREQRRKAFRGTFQLQETNTQQWNVFAILWE